MEARPKILIVEDEKKISNFLKKGLEEERYEVETVNEGNRALRMLTKNKYDLILLDLMLPGLDGYSLLREARGKSIDTPVLILSARNSIDDRITGLSIGADDYLPKPFNFEELLARIKAIMRRTNPEKAFILTSGKVVLNTITHIAYVNNKEIDLTTKEYQLLEFLIRNKNKILSRSSITMQVWKQEFDPDSNIIDVYIKRLRTKLNIELRDNPQIESIRGVGYKLSETGTSVTSYE